MTTTPDSRTGHGPTRGESWPRPALRLCEHTVDEAARRRVRRGWARNWLTATTFGLAAGLCGVYLWLLGILGVFGKLAGQSPPTWVLMGVLWLLFSAQVTVVAVPVWQGGVWVVETLRGRCSRRGAAVAAGVALGGALAAIVAAVQVFPAVTEGLSAALYAMVNGGDAAPVSGQVAEQLHPVTPWLAAAVAVTVAIWVAPGAPGHFGAGRLDYRTVDATRYLPIDDVDRYLDTPPPGGPRAAAGIGGRVGPTTGASGAAAGSVPTAGSHTGGGDRSGDEHAQH
ncbi:hypothetical protein ACLTEW_24440 [Gordonia lacunae]|uniref:hypothetical protein n=1 Tax=Gordonia TaxID=2053 RepID=UPI00200B4E34|nr:hypothetical protein [Gordonia terrae]UPW12016.1 hypothetical protein M1C59_25535 [Gordonia terrae]